MFAIIKTGGKQYRVSVGDILEVERLSVKAGSPFDFEEILLIDDGAKTWLGNPYLPKARVRAELIEEFKDEKVIVFKKKRRKQYKKKKGHRQIQSRVKILEIIPDFEIKEKVTPEVKPPEEARPIQTEEMKEVEVVTPESKGPSKIIEKEIKAGKKAKAPAKKKGEKRTESSKS